jgi:hypothetical protein
MLEEDLIEIEAEMQEAHIENKRKAQETAVERKAALAKQCVFLFIHMFGTFK